MALRTFTGNRNADTVGKANTLRAWQLASTAGATVDFCDGTSATPIFTVILPANSSSGQAYPQPGITFPNGLAINVTAGSITRGAVDY